MSLDCCKVEGEYARESNEPHSRRNTEVDVSQSECNGGAKQPAGDDVATVT